MPRPAIDRRILGAGAGVAALTAAVGLAAHRDLRRRIGADPQSDALRKSAHGAPMKITAPDGTEIHAETFGAKSGSTVVLIHGWTETIAIWTLVIRDLVAQGLRVVAYDLRGHGKSGRPADGDYSVTRFGDDLEAVLAAVVPEGERAVVAGHSLGAMSIAAWAEHHDVPHRAGAAALIHTGVGGLIAESLLVPLPKLVRGYTDAFATRAFLGSRAPLPKFSTPLSHAMIRYVAFGPEASPALVAFFERMVIACAADVRADVGLAISKIDLYDALANLTVPTAVVAGEKDKLTPPSHARRMAELLPDLHSLEVLDGVGHMGPLERPERVSATLLKLAQIVTEAAAVPT